MLGFGCAGQGPGLSGLSGVSGGGSFGESLLGGNFRGRLWQGEFEAEFEDLCGRNWEEETGCGGKVYEEVAKYELKDWRERQRIQKQQSGPVGMYNINYDFFKSLYISGKRYQNEKARSKFFLLFFLIFVIRGFVLLCWGDEGKEFR